MADKTFPLLEFVSFCFEKNEIEDGWSLRWCPFRTPDLARKQYDRLVLEATRLLGDPSREVQYGVCWPDHLMVQLLGAAVMVRVAAPRDGAAWVWGDGDPDWGHCNASGDLSRLFETEP